MRKPVQTLVIAILAGLSSAVSSVRAEEEDSLFSSVRAATAFNNETGSAGAVSVVGVQRLTSTDELVHLLQEANFDTSSSGTRIAVTQKQLDSWIFPVLATLSEDEQDVSIVLGLRAVKDSQKVPAARLLRLLESNEKSGRTSFAFNRDRNRIELFSLVKNSGVSAQLLRDEINRLAILARNTETLWNLEESAGGATLAQASSVNGGATKVTVTPVAGTSLAPVPAKPTAQAPAKPSAPAPIASAPTKPSPPSATIPAVSAPQSAPASGSSPQVASSSLQGRWSATRSATEAFAILLSTDGTFVLVSVKDGKQAKSTGKFSLQNSQLTLETNDGGRLLGKVSLVSTSEFRFEQQTSGATGTPLTFRKAQ